ncbi:cardiolipin synthase [Coralloluteibacterium thermophilus]|uniref:Cardiolipin synthase n=1 Tax=Coralloluteibacterium thermophilum TaxID=2707049 RepID=A0ABV9NPV7_9GAMM
MLDALAAVPWWQLLSIAWAIHIAGIVVWIVLQKRDPAATLSWIFALALLPVLGFLVFYLVGPQRIRRQRQRRLRSRNATQHGLPESQLDAHDGLPRLAFASGEFPPSSCTQVDFLQGGGSKFDHLLEAIASAEHHVHMEYYIFEPDDTGRLVRDALVARARAGVRVRLLLDGVGSARLGRRFLRPLREAGGEVAWFHSLRHGRIRRRPRINLRTHRKIAVIDGRIGFTGGVNICDDGNERLSTTAYHDLHVRMEGRVVHWLQQAFCEDWHYATRQAINGKGYWPELPPGPHLAQVVPSGPDTVWEPLHRLHVDAIARADRRVWLVTPYFVPTAAARMALTSAALRGLDVRLLVPRMSDSRLVTWCARSYYDELLDAGVRIFEFGPNMLHTKALLVDEEIALVGSANFDPRSFRLNFELSTLWCDRTIAARLAELVLADQQAAAELPRRRPHQPLRWRLAEAGARLLSPLL